MALIRSNSLLHSSTGSAYMVIESLAARGQPNAYLAHVLASRTTVMPPEVVLETFVGVGNDQARFDLLFAEDLWLPQQLRAAQFIRLFEAGKVHDAQRSNPPLPYVALEPVQGARLVVLLDVALASRRRLPVHITIKIALEIGRGLAYLHGMNSADGLPLRASYRGLCPSSIFISRDGAVRLLPPVTRWLAGAPERSPENAELAYVAPELLQGGPNSPRSDLWALGVMMWSMLAGQPLFVGKTQFETLKAVRADKPPQLGKMGLAVPPPLEALVSSLLQKALASRPAAAEDVVRVLEEISQRLSDGPSLAVLAEQWLSGSSLAKPGWPSFASVRDAT